MSNGFTRFDFEDGKLNEAAYGQPSAPLIDLAQIKIPVALMVGVQDTLATLADNMTLRDQIDPE